jgi:hypothetical protein
LANKAPRVASFAGVAVVSEPGPFAAEYRIVAVPLLPRLA